MVDPSVLFSEEGFAWLEEDPTARSGIVVASTVMRWLRGGEIDLQRRYFIAPEDVEVFDRRREQLLRLLDEVPTFSYQEARLSPEHDAVQRNLFEIPGREGFADNSLYADEWAFLQSHSFLISKLRNPLDVFRDAGSTIVEFGQKVGRQLVLKVIKAEHVPPVLTPTLMAKATVKWIVVGGAAVGGGTLAGVAGTVIGGPAGALIGGKVGGVAAGAITNAALLAIDP